VIKSTTPDLVELQKRLTEAADRRDEDAIVALYGPDGVWDMSPMGMGAFERQAAVRDFFEDWFASYGEFEVEAEEILDLRNGVGFRVLVASNFTVRSRTSTPFAQPRSCAWRCSATARPPSKPWAWPSRRCPRT
jgi:ketosteroid isomerase-like protein